MDARQFISSFDKAWEEFNQLLNDDEDFKNQFQGAFDEWFLDIYLPTQ